MQMTSPDPERWRRARHAYRVDRARERLDGPLGTAFEQLNLEQRIVLALHVARDLVGFALRDTLDLQTRYALATSYSEPISDRAAALAQRLSALLDDVDATRAMLDDLTAVPEPEWTKWSPPGRPAPS